jgi:anti-sigma-K factor RskA
MGASRFRRSAVALAAAALLALVPAERSIAREQPAPTVLEDLRSVDDFATLFDRDAGKVRLVLLLSPT